MKWRCAAKLPAFLGILGALGSGPALAANRRCSPLAVEADANVRSRWPELAERVRDAFDARDDIDACARVKLTLSGATIAVQVVLLDGRSASRSVSRPEGRGAHPRSIAPRASAPSATGDTRARTVWISPAFVGGEQRAVARRQRIVCRPAECAC